MNRKSAYRLRDRPRGGELRRGLGQGTGGGQDKTVDVGPERALVGERVPIVRDGRVVGERFRYDNRLAMAVLNALDRRAVAWPLSPAMDEALFAWSTAEAKLRPLLETKDSCRRHEGLSCLLAGIRSCL